MQQLVGPPDQLSQEPNSEEETAFGSLKCVRLSAGLKLADYRRVSFAPRGQPRSDVVFRPGSARETPSNVAEFHALRNLSSNNATWTDQG